MDLCTNCTVRGDIEACLKTPCSQHNSWFAKTLLDNQKSNEPVAVFNEQLGRPVLLASAPMLEDKQPLYTHPQPRAWVGLTDEEIEDIHCTPPRERPRGKFPFARMIEAKLKEKNYQEGEADKNIQS